MSFPHVTRKRALAVAVGDALLVSVLLVGLSAFGGPARGRRVRTSNSRMPLRGCVQTELIRLNYAEAHLPAGSPPASAVSLPDRDGDGRVEAPAAAFVAVVREPLEWRLERFIEFSSTGFIRPAILSLKSSRGPPAA